MRTFIQLRNNVGFAVLHTAGGEPDHSVTPDHTTAIEVTGHENPDSLIRKKYDEETKTWSDAPVFRIADINHLGDILEIRRTVYEHEIDADTILMPDEADHLWHYIDGNWVAPVVAIQDAWPPVEVIDAPSQEGESSGEITAP